VVSEKDASSESTIAGVADADVITTADFIRRPPSGDDLPVPVAEHDLRDMFGAPMGSGASIEQAAVSGRKPAVSDAEALFQDEPARRRKPKGAEARAQSRRCTRCGGHVPQGMSICVSCGVDQDTGVRVGLDDDLAPPPPRLATGPPLHIAIIGFLCGLASVVLLVLALIMSVRGEAGVAQYGWLCLALVSGFGIYGAVQFFTGRTVKYLMLALTLGVFVNLVSLIGLPIVQASLEAPDRLVRQVPVNKGDPEAFDAADIEIKSYTERINWDHISYGLTVILIYVILSIYLMSPPVKRHFARQAALANLNAL
jgi:hypothetical protein